MRDPHVQHLIYRLQHGENVSFDDPPPVHVDNAQFSAVLRDGLLTVVMNDHFASVSDARAAVDPIVRAWELQEELMGTTRGITFVYETAELIDRNPPPPGESIMLTVHNAVHAHFSDSATLKVLRHAYPPAPETFSVTPDLETMWLRYSGYLEGREPLPAMAYFCLTVLEASAGGRKEAAELYSIDPKVFSKIGELSSSRGDSNSARKARANRLPLSAGEKNWLELVLRRLIARVGEVAGGRDVRTLTVADFQGLENDGAA
jgi:hypothetical protein